MWRDRGQLGGLICSSMVTVVQKQVDRGQGRLQGARRYVLMGAEHHEIVRAGTRWPPGAILGPGRHRVLAYFATYPVLPARSPALTVQLSHP
jgi:hypothetical protein